MKSAMTAPLEDYLETILFILEDCSEVHASEIAQRMAVTRASVTGALRALADRGLITYTPYQPVQLTEAGRLQAQACADRHHFLHGFFRDILGLADPEAEAVACRLEHVTGSGAMDRLIQFARFFDANPDWKARWQDQIQIKND